MKKSISLLVAIMVMILAFLLIGCEKEWYDDGYKYLCPDCMGMPVLEAEGTCESCSCTISTCSFKFCYACAKRMDRCQRCGTYR